VIVIDASSLAKYILREDNWEIVRQNLLDNPVSIDLALTEVSNAIWKHCLVYSRIPPSTAELMFRALLETQEVIEYKSSIEYLKAAQEISITEEIPIYDALYIAQAQKYRKLLTSDKKQSKIARALGISVEFVD